MARVDIMLSSGTISVSATGRDATDDVATIPVSAGDTQPFSIRFVRGDEQRLRISDADREGVVADAPSKLAATTVLRLGGDDTRFDLGDVRLG